MTAAHADPLNALWVLLAFGLLVKALMVFRAAFIPFERLSVLVLSVGRIVRHL